MVPTFVSRLRVIVLAAVVIPGLADLSITDTSSSVIQSPQQSQLATLPDGYVAHPDIGVAYKGYSEYVSWPEARRRCISEGAHLAVIDTRLKFDYLLSLESIYVYSWTGIHKIPGDTRWFSNSTGFAMTTLPWADGEPSFDDDCVFASARRYGLMNLECNSEMNYACELPIP